MKSKKVPQPHGFPFAKAVKAPKGNLQTHPEKNDSEMINKTRSKQET